LDESDFKVTDVRSNSTRQSNDKIKALNASLQEANRLFRAGQPQPAIDFCHKILMAVPGEPNALHMLGVIAKGQGELDRSAAYMRRACLSPSAPATAFADLSETLRRKGLDVEAERMGRRAVAIDDKLPYAWNNLGVIVQNSDAGPDARAARFAEARACFDRAITLNPEYFEAYWNRGTLAMLQGKFEQAWPDFEWRKRKQGHNLQIASAQPIWSGLEDISNKTILVHWEQGLGDTIQFCRYVALLSKVAGKVLFWPQKPLMAMMRRANLGAEIVDFDDKTLRYDFRIPLMSLPVVLKTNLASIPRRERYITPDPERVAHWKQTLSPEGFKIGISWKGSSGPIDVGRSVPLTAFLPLLEIPGVRLISLQKFEGLYELYNLPKGIRIETLGDAFDAGPDGFSDTMAVMGLCDLIITSDTAIAHLAGGLGVPTWVALKKMPDWRWFLDRQDCPWYNSVRLFRQETSGDWDGVFTKMTQAVAQVLGGAPVLEAAPITEETVPVAETTQNLAKPAIVDNKDVSTIMEPLPTPVSPISWGEYIDKLTILEIKSERISEPKALTDVLTELSRLFSSADGRWLSNGQLLGCKARLRKVNEALWQIEDDIRDKEAQQEFDQNFIKLARSVYQRNDERAAIKREINTLMKSDFSEQKLYKAY
jgi:tetratricopeptide (TPR) repeat protein